MVRRNTNSRNKTKVFGGFKLKVKKIWFGGIPTLGTNQQGSEEYKLKMQNNRVRRNTNSRYKTIGFGGIQTLGTKQQGSEEYKRHGFLTAGFCRL